MSNNRYQDYRTAGFSILIADDQQFMLKNLGRYFSEFFDVKTASSQNEAQEILQNSIIGVIICDHQMADGQGVSILEFVRNNYPNTRRILITADRHEDVVIEMMDNKLVHSFAYKPTVKKQLHTLVVEQAEIFISSAQ